jgi:hypothetical protein
LSSLAVVACFDLGLTAYSYLRHQTWSQVEVLVAPGYS